MLTLLVDNTVKFIPIIGVLSLLGAAITFLWGVVIYLLNRSREMKEAEFNRFHEIIRKIQHDKDSTGNNTAPYIEIQIAALYELRFLNRYHPMALIYLKEKRVEWANNGGKYLSIGVPVIDSTIGSIESRLCSNSSNPIWPPHINEPKSW